MRPVSSLLLLLVCLCALVFAQPHAVPDRAPRALSKPARDAHALDVKRIISSRQLTRTELVKRATRTKPKRQNVSALPTSTPVIVFVGVTVTGPGTVTLSLSGNQDVTFVVSFTSVAAAPKARSIDSNSSAHARRDIQQGDVSCSVDTSLVVSCTAKGLPVTFCDSPTTQSTIGTTDGTCPVGTTQIQLKAPAPAPAPNPTA